MKGMYLGGLMFLVFLVLKVLGKIEWSWWWVTVPLWGPTVLRLVVMVLAFWEAYENDQRRR